jgi:hypothetical protein
LPRCATWPTIQIIKDVKKQAADRAKAKKYRYFALFTIPHNINQFSRYDSKWDGPKWGMPNQKIYNIK